MKYVKGVIFMVVLCMVTGCTDTEHQETTESDFQKETEITTKKVVLKVLSTTIVESPEKELEQQLAETFMAANKDIVIEYIGVPINNVSTQLSTLAIEDNMPDIFVNLPEFRNKLYDLDIIADLRRFFDDSFLEQIYPELMIEAIQDEEMVFLPWSMVSMGVIYRTDWFEEKKLRVPKDWSAFQEVAKALTEDTNGDGVIDRWGLALVGAKNNSGAVRFTNVLRSFGAYELRYADHQWVTDMDSPEGIAALTYYGELYTKHKVVPPGPVEVSYEEAIAWMKNEKTAMMITGSHAMASIVAKNPGLKGKLGSFLIPMGSQHTSTLGIHGYSIAKTSPHKEEAVRFLKFLLEKDNQIRWFEQTGRIPSTVYAGEVVLGRDDAYSGFYEAFQYIEPFPRVSYYADMPDILGQAYQQVLTESQEPRIAAKEAANRIRQIIDNSNIKNEQE